MVLSKTRHTLVGKDDGLAVALAHGGQWATVAAAGLGKGRGGSRMHQLGGVEGRTGGDKGGS